MTSIYENLKLLRQSKGLTQADVAEAISVTRQTISSYESGRTQPDLETLMRLAEIYQTDLHDILYGGNRLQRNLRIVKLAAFILVSVLLLGILTHSTLTWAMNHFFKVTNNTLITEANRSFIEMRFALRDAAYTVSTICSNIFSIGCLVMLYPAIRIAYYVSYRKIFLFFFSTISALSACTIPFALVDEIYAPINYFIPTFGGLVNITLLLAVTLAAKLITTYSKRRRRTST